MNNTKGNAGWTAEQLLLSVEALEDLVGVIAASTQVEMLRAYAATLSQQAGQPEDARCPPTYRREEAVTMLIGMGWHWDGHQWQRNKPPQADVAVSDEDVELAGQAYFEHQWEILPPRSKGVYRRALKRALESYACRHARQVPDGSVSVQSIQQVIDELGQSDVPALIRLRKKLERAIKASPKTGESHE